MSQIITTDFGVALIDDDTHISKYIIEERRLDCRGSYPNVAERFLKQGGIAVDAGACLGDHTFVCLKLVGDTGKVYAFEPHPLAFECLSRNCPKAALFKYALSDHDGSATLHSEMNIGASYLTSEPGSAALMMLDSLNLPKLDWFKIDVEGMESAVIRGAKETISRCRPRMLIELNDGTLMRYGETKQNVIQLMQSLSYRMELCNPDLGLGFVAVDAVFLPE